MVEPTDFDYIHALPGRLRVKVREVRQSPEMAEAAECVLRSIAGVHQATANSVTGNVLVLFEQDATDVRRLVETLHDHGFTLKRQTPRRPPARSLVHQPVCQELAMLACGELLKFSIRAAISAI